MILSPLPIQRFYDANNVPLFLGQLFTYAAGTTTKIATYTDSTGGTPNTNPVILNPRGEAQVWIDPTKAYKFVLALPTDSDPPSNPIWTVDGITNPGNAQNTATDTGSVNNVILTIPILGTPQAFAVIFFKAANTNTGAVTMTVNGVTKPLTWQNLAALAGGEIQANGIYEAVFDGTQWQLQGPTLQPPQLRTPAEIAAGVTPVNYGYPSLHAFRYMTAAQIADVSLRVGSLDVRAALQSLITVGQVEGGTCYCPAGVYLINSVAGLDAQNNGIIFPYTSAFAYVAHLTFKGDGWATEFRAGSNNMTVIRHSDSLNVLRDFAINGNGRTGVTGISLIGSNTANVALAENIDWNKFYAIRIEGCQEGIEFESPSAGGCYYNGFFGCRSYNNTRHLRFRDNAVAGGANRNAFFDYTMNGGNTGVYIDGADTNRFLGCTFEGISVGASPLANPTAVYINSVGTLHGLSTQDTNLIDCIFEQCTRDLDCSNRRTSILGGNCGAVGAIAGSATPDVWIGGDAPYLLRELFIGSQTADGLSLNDRISAFTTYSNAMVATSANIAGGFPFNNDGSLILKSRSQNASGISTVTGATPTERHRMDGNGHFNFLSGVVDVGFGNSATAPVIVNGNTINTVLNTVARVAPGGAVTGIILQAGTQPGQKCVVINESAAGNTVAFAAAGTSNVADGVGSVIAGLNSRTFYWNSTTLLWYPSK